MQSLWRSLKLTMRLVLQIQVNPPRRTAFFPDEGLLQVQQGGKWLKAAFSLDEGRP